MIRSIYLCVNKMINFHQLRYIARWYKTRFGYKETPL